MEPKQKHTNCTKCGGYLEPLWKKSISGVCGKCRNLPVVTAQVPFCRTCNADHDPIECLRLTKLSDVENGI